MTLEPFRIIRNIHQITFQRALLYQTEEEFCLEHNTYHCVGINRVLLVKEMPEWIIKIKG